MAECCHSSGEGGATCRLRRIRTPVPLRDTYPLLNARKCSRVIRVYGGAYYSSPKSIFDAGEVGEPLAPFSEEGVCGEGRVPAMNEMSISVVVPEHYAEDMGYSLSIFDNDSLSAWPSYCNRYFNVQIG